MGDKRSLFAAVAFTVAFVTVALSAPRLADQVTKMYLNEGNTMSGFSVDCTSTTWTTLRAADAEIRSSLIQSIGTNSYNVCLASSTGGGACANGVDGAEIAPSGNITDYGEYAIYCRSRSPSAGERIKGYTSYDSRD